MDGWEGILPCVFFDIREIQEAKKGKAEQEKLAPEYQKLHVVIQLRLEEPP